MTAFERFWRFVYWLWIVASPTLVGGIIAALVYFSIGGVIGASSAILLALAGVTLGVFWAERVRRTIGTIELVTAAGSESESAPESESESESESPPESAPNH
jgi:hypothetical protein